MVYTHASLLERTELPGAPTAGKDSWPLGTSRGRQADRAAARSFPPPLGVVYSTAHPLLCKCRAMAELGIRGALLKLAPAKNSPGGLGQTLLSCQVSSPILLQMRL